MTADRMAELEAKLAEQDTRLAQQDARIRELEDVREIKDCFRRFHWETTGGFAGIQAGKMEALDWLADDATIEVKGKHEPGKGPTGRKQYTAYWDYFYGDAGPLPYVFQTAISEFVEVSGDNATGKSVMLGLFQFRGGEPRLSMALRTNSYRRTEKGWRIMKTTIDGGFGFNVDEFKSVQDPLNELPPQEERQEWKWPGV